MALPRILLTPGEPAGIGPDLVIALAQRESAVELICVADPQLLQQRAQQLRLPLQLETWRSETARSVSRRGTLKILPMATKTPVIAGQLDTRNAAYVVETLRTAAAMCLKREAEAIVTGPVHKGVINDAGISFTGHTEFFAEQAHVSHVVMMLATKHLRVALVTTHLPLSAVSSHITQENVEATLRILHRDLQRQFGLPSPRILVCGLNPHAGEGGHLGHEDQTAIAPALQRLRAEGMQLEGPVPADTAFIPKRLQHTDAVLAMYHDQGLPVLKYAGFGEAINITLGLPFIRTSVDHGTALELAGTGSADATSLFAALDTAVHAAEHLSRESPRSA